MTYSIIALYEDENECLHQITLFNRLCSLDSALPLLKNIYETPSDYIACDSMVLVDCYIVDCEGFRVRVSKN
ncbi:hypothetical protein [Capybara microvirus Cap3_SP_330]|nr:hypothetical protein [Capybara microvirus Cap3_SP_330]